LAIRRQEIKAQYSEDFEELWERFKKTVNVEEFETYNEIEVSFRSYLGLGRNEITNDQIAALMYEAREEGIGVPSRIIRVTVARAPPEYRIPRPPIEEMAVERVPVYYGVKVQARGTRWQYPRGTVIGGKNVGGKFIKQGPYYTAVSPRMLKTAYAPKR
jgi:hypothetical protein